MATVARAAMIRTQGMTPTLTPIQTLIRTPMTVPAAMMAMVR